MLRSVTPSIPAPHFDSYQTRDRFGRQIYFYVSEKEKEASLPLSVFIQGSGCHSVFRVGRDGRVHGGYQNVLLQVSRGRSLVLAVEKPGVSYLDNPMQAGTAEGCGKEFLREHTLPRWGEAIGACLRAARRLPGVDRRRLLLVGHSEGGIVAAHVAASNPWVSHIALLSSSGPSQLFDLIQCAKSLNSRANDEREIERRVNKILNTFASIRKAPASISRFAWGHPYRRWSSFLGSSTLEEILKSRAKVFMVHGSQDPVVPVASFEFLRSELIRRGVDVTARLVAGAGHNLAPRGSMSLTSMRRTLASILNWFLDS